MAHGHPAAATELGERLRPRVSAVMLLEEGRPGSLAHEAGGGHNTEARRDCCSTGAILGHSNELP